MEIILLALLGIGVLAGAVAGSGGGDDGGEGEGEGIGGSSEPGAGGYGPDDEHDLVWGSRGADVIDGSGFMEVIEAYQGDDTISGGDGNDRIFADEGSDKISAGAGDDSVYGDSGDDVIDGGVVSAAFGDPDAFIAELESRAGWNDPLTLTDQEHADIAALGTADVAEDFGSDLLRGEDDDDIIADGFGADTLHGDLGNDLLISVDVADSGTDPDADEVYGGFNSDTLIGDSGDTLSGGGGHDHFVIANGLNATDVGDETFATLTDFDPTKETLQIENLDSEYGDGTLTYDEQPEGTYLQVGGVTVALFSGLTETDLTSATITVNARSS